MTRKDLGVRENEFIAFSFPRTKETIHGLFTLISPISETNNNRNDNTDLWHGSLASTVEAIKKPQAWPANIGSRITRTRASIDPISRPIFWAGSSIHPKGASISIWRGKGGLTNPETDIPSAAALPGGFKCTYLTVT